MRAETLEQQQQQQQQQRQQQQQHPEEPGNLGGSSDSGGGGGGGADLLLELVAANANALDAPQWALLDDKVALHRLLLAQQQRRSRSRSSSRQKHEHKSDSEAEDTTAAPSRRSWWPTSFEWPAQRAAALDFLRREKGAADDEASLWVLKAANGWGGHGNAFVTSKQALAGIDGFVRRFEGAASGNDGGDNAIAGKGRYLLQRYVAPPMLLSGRKFSLRVFVVVVGCDLRRGAYLSREGLVKLAGRPWAAASSTSGQRVGPNEEGFDADDDDENTDADDEDRHVTNSARREQRQRFGGGGGEDEEEQFDLSVLRAHLDGASSSSSSSNPSAFDALWADIEAAVGECMSLLLPAMEEEGSEGGGGCSVKDRHAPLLLPKILGVDVLVSEEELEALTTTTTTTTTTAAAAAAATPIERVQQGWGQRRRRLRPWVIEVNRFPGLAHRGAADRRVKAEVMEAAWRLACNEHAARQQQQQQQQQQQRHHHAHQAVLPGKEGKERNDEEAALLAVEAARARRVVGLETADGSRIPLFPGDGDDGDSASYYTAAECDASLTPLQLPSTTTWL
jgi:hypothetical protein